jgi:NAD(P)-dependent dehydrogenase (short-subunit alcohol dehydrogenase family)
MSKHATRALADILRCELSQWGVSVHDIQPGFFRQVFRFDLKDILTVLLSFNILVLFVQEMVVHTRT